MYCPQCGIQIEHQTKFCKTCGLKLAEHARLLDEPREADAMNETQARGEKRLTTAVMLLLSAVANLLFFFFLFAVETLPSLRAVKEPHLFLAYLVTFLVSFPISLTAASLGLAHLVRSGFFKNMKERQLRYEQVLFEAKRKALEESTESKTLEINVPLRPAQVVSLTEDTTHELDHAPVTTNKLKGA